MVSMVSMHCCVMYVWGHDLNYHEALAIHWQEQENVSVEAWLVRLLWYHFSKSVYDGDGKNAFFPAEWFGHLKVKYAGDTRDMTATRFNSIRIHDQTIVKEQPQELCEGFCCLTTFWKEMLKWQQDTSKRRGSISLWGGGRREWNKTPWNHIYMSI